jgi:hypothetical protein
VTEAASTDAALAEGSTEAKDAEEGAEAKDAEEAGAGGRNSNLQWLQLLDAMTVSLATPACQHIVQFLSVRIVLA